MSLSDNFKTCLTLYLHRIFKIHAYPSKSHLPKKKNPTWKRVWISCVTLNNNFNIWWATISKKFSKPIFLLTFSRRIDKVRKEYERHDSDLSLVAQSMVRLEAKMSELVNAYRNEKTLSYQPLTNLDIPNSIKLTHDSYCFGN